MTKAILVAVDLSQEHPDEKTLRIAKAQAEAESAHLDVLTVVPDLGVGDVSVHFPPGYQDKAVAAAHEHLEAFCSKVLGDTALKVRREVAVGKVYQEVLRVAEAAGSDLIVIGSHKPALRDYLLGTNASQIVRHANCSVYVVR